jgi:hypothetical protein
MNTVLTEPGHTVYITFSAHYVWRDYTYWICKNKTNSMALARKRAIPTERLPLVGEVSVNFLRIEVVAWSAQRIHTAVFSVL